MIAPFAMSSNTNTPDAMRNVTCGCGDGVILGCYEDATVGGYGNEDLYPAMRNVPCGCGCGIILGCYEDATVRYGNDLYHNDWFCGGGVILIADCYGDGATVIVMRMVQL